MGNAVLCGSGDGEPAAYMITDMVDGGNTLVCPAHWLDLCAAMLGVTLPPPADAPPGPADSTTPADDTGQAAELPPGRVPEGYGRGVAPLEPRPEDMALVMEPDPQPEDDQGRGFAPRTVARALSDEPAPGEAAEAPPPAPRKPQRRRAV